MGKRIFLLFTAALLIFNLSSCFFDKEHTPCRKILDELLALEEFLPAGRIFELDAEIGDDEYISYSLLSALYGGKEKQRIREGWVDLALFIPTGSHPCELAVIYCNSPANASDTASLLSARLSAIRLTKSSAEYSDYIENACVTVSGNYVTLIISKNSKNALSLLKRAL